MITIFTIIIFSSLWSLFIKHEFTLFHMILDKIGLSYPRKLVSEYLVIDFIIWMLWKLLNCANCQSYHICWILIYICTGSWIGLFFGIASYFLVNLFYDIFLKIKL